MANKVVSDADLLQTALSLFRAHGYDGVSLKQLSDAAGLEKASLYYRYPGGKDEIVMAVAGEVQKWFDRHVIQPLKESTVPAKKIETVARNLRDYYGNGTKSCVADVLSLPGGPDTLRRAIKGVMEDWIGAFAAVARENGLSPASARLQATEAVTRIEGSLILARVTDDRSVFERALKAVVPLLTP